MLIRKQKGCNCNYFGRDGTHVYGAPAVHTIAPNTLEVTFRQAFAKRSNQAHVSGLIARTVVTVHVMMFHMPLVAVLRH